MLNAESQTSNQQGSFSEAKVPDTDSHPVSSLLFPRPKLQCFKTWVVFLPCKLKKIQVEIKM